MKEVGDKGYEGNDVGMDVGYYFRMRIDTYPDGLGDPAPLTDPSNRPALGSPDIRFLRTHLEPRGSLHMAQGTEPPLPVQTARPDHPPFPRTISIQ